jgi:hypothetical protein
VIRPHTGCSDRSSRTTAEKVGKKRSSLLVERLIISRKTLKIEMKLATRVKRLNLADLIGRVNRPYGGLRVVSIGEFDAKNAKKSTLTVCYKEK